MSINDETGAATEVPIRDSMIRLGQLVKLANLAEDGVEAKELIENGLVKVNGEIEDRRGVVPGQDVLGSGRRHHGAPGRNDRRAADGPMPVAVSCAAGAAVLPNCPNTRTLHHGSPKRE